MSTPAEDTEHLRLLSIFYYVWGGLTLCFSCLGGIWIAVVLGAFAVASNQGGQGPPHAVAGFMAAIGGFAVVFALVASALAFWCGKCIADRRKHTFILVVAALTCLSFPIGTALGVFTFIVLTRSGVKGLFMPTPAAVS